ncbi:MAG: anti-sigma F factor [Clostridia bacterium]|nr:anti-sigma F factor [Clostridia bacterium]
MKLLNEFNIKFLSKSENESFSRIVITAFVSQFSPTVEDIADIKTAVSEAVTNCVVHAYKNSTGYIQLSAKYYDNGKLRIIVKDKGCGIPDIEKARKPLYTTDAENERSGMGFPIMESFTDKLRIISQLNKGTTVVMEKNIGCKPSI